MIYFQGEIMNEIMSYLVKIVNEKKNMKKKLIGVYE